MTYSAQIKPVSYLEAHASELLDRIAEDRSSVIITQDGEARAVLQDLASYEETQETLALLKLVALGRKDVEAGRVTSARELVARLRESRGEA